MKQTTERRKFIRRTTRAAVGLALLAVAAAGMGVAPGGAGAANGWGRSRPTTNIEQPTTTVKSSTVVSTGWEPSTNAVVDGNGWG